MHSFPKQGVTFVMMSFNIDLLFLFRDVIQNFQQYYQYIFIQFWTGPVYLFTCKRNVLICRSCLKLNLSTLWQVQNAKMCIVFRFLFGFFSVVFLCFGCFFFLVISFYLDIEFKRQIHASRCNIPALYGFPVVYSNDFTIVYGDIGQI